jgi:enoyl-CoA hydratase/carnithine racemase
MGCLRYDQSSGRTTNSPSITQASEATMAYEGYKLISFVREGKIVTATIDAPPINIITLELYSELNRMSRELETDPDCLVFVLKSANADFFLAHFDVNAILQFPIDQPASREASASNEYHNMCNRMSTMDKVTIAQIEGRVGGGGSEFSMGFDMRFGVRGKTKINQMEVPLGILPGGSGTQKLPRLVGRNRAIEIILAGLDMTAEDAERWGYLNRAFRADEIGPYVMSLARRIASFPAEAVKLAKQAINSAAKPLAEGLQDESYLFQQLIRTESGRRNMEKFLEIGGQTGEGEQRIDELNRKLGEP